MAWKPLNKLALQTEVNLFPFGPHSGSIRDWDISTITDLSNLFRNKTCVLNGDMLSKWDVSHVTNMDGMFLHASNMNANINSWDVSSVTRMSEMFAYATSFNQPLDLWNVSNVKFMADMFFNATSFKKSLKSWRVPQLEMFGGSNSQITELFVFTPLLESLHVENCKLTTIQIPTDDMDIDFQCRNNPFTLNTVENLIHYFENHDADPTELDYLLQRKEYLLIASKTINRKIGEIPITEVTRFLGGKPHRKLTRKPKRKPTRKTYRKKRKLS